MRRLHAVLLFAAASLVTACGHSPPTHYFALQPVTAGGARAGAPAAPVRVAAVHLPQELNRLEMVTGLGSSRLQLRGTEVWAAPLADMTRRVLAEDLEARLPGGSVIFPHSPAPRSAGQLVVDVQAFGTQATGDGVLEASWSLIGPDGQPAAGDHLRLTAPAAGQDAASEAAVMSRLLGELADRIAAGVPARSSPGPG